METDKEQVITSEGCSLETYGFGLQGRHVALEVQLRKQIRRPQTLNRRP